VDVFICHNSYPCCNHCKVLHDNFTLLLFVRSRQCCEQRLSPAYHLPYLSLIYHYIGTYHLVICFIPFCDTFLHQKASVGASIKCWYRPKSRNGKKVQGQYGTVVKQRTIPLLLHYHIFVSFMVNRWTDRTPY